MKTQNPTFYDTIIVSPEWQAWVRENEIEPRFDVHESMECGWLSKEHFAAFLKFAARQHYLHLVLQFRDLVKCSDEQLQTIIESTL
jgi:hypothetical protein